MSGLFFAFVLGMGVGFGLLMAVACGVEIGRYRD